MLKVGMVKIGLTGLGLLMAASVSSAADAPSLTGTWKGPGQGVGKEAGWTNDEATLEITEQRGPAFIGQVIYDKDRREDFFGMIAADGKTVRTVDGDGLYVGAFTAPDTLDLCYFEVGADAEANCWVLKRAP